MQYQCSFDVILKWFEAVVSGNAFKTYSKVVMANSTS